MSEIKDIFFLVGLTILFSIACSSPELNSHEELMPREEFLQIVIEMNQIEAIRSMNMGDDNTSKLPSEAFYNALWKGDEDKKERFLKSFEHYKSRPEELATIYEEAAATIKRQEDELIQLKKARKKQLDSLERARENGSFNSLEQNTQ